MTLPSLAALCAAVALIGLGAHFYPAGNAWTLGLVAAAPYLMLTAPVAVALFGVAGQWAGVALAVVLVALCAGSQAPLWRRSAAPAASRDLVVLTANLWLGRADPDAVVRAVREHEVDVLLVEEVTVELQEQLVAAGLAALLPHHASRPGESAAGLGLWSRFPLVDVRRYDGFWFPPISARVAVPGVPVAPTFLVLHLAGPVPHAAQWRRDIARLPAVLTALPTDAPVIVGGDFNATPDIVQFRRVLGAGYRSAARQAGAGHLPTWPAHRWRPIIAIDHVLTRGTVARAAGSLTIPGSDHRALLARLALPLSSGARAGGSTRASRSRPRRRR